jgi:1,4-alpha-glucan branching enzyme
VPREHYRLGVPEKCFYREVLNSDSTYYGGSNVGNGEGLQAEDRPSHGRPWSVELTLPPLAVTVYKPTR